ncbi:phage tail protein [Halalkalibacter sp. APA_J-10(15)]|uniref:phage tail protein n=1 Tax=unclassified Halalkalibacter TaxID=2893063 RepID=UPI001FF27D13|nr:tail fiber protein [Halalkalibacter sp. APA_J-10(15)]MCK0470508.1 tail fiber protein [Halalkalibacter sp. APA_J-10(15)]
MDPLIGEVRLFTGNFAPKGWAFCDGQLISISQHVSLFSVIGTTYGGNGTTTFALPDLRDRIAIHQGQGSGLVSREIGEIGGEKSITLLESQMPQHAHVPQSQSENDEKSPIDALWADSPTGRLNPNVYSSEAPDTSMNSRAVQPEGGGAPHNNMQPYVGMHFIIALEGIIPIHS